MTPGIAPQTPSSKLDVGDLLRSTGQALARNGAGLFVIGLAASLPGILLKTAIALSQADPYAVKRLAEVAATQALGFQILGLVALAVTLILTFLAQVAGLYLVMEQMAGRRPTIGEALKKPLERLGPLLLTSILCGVIVALGVMLCILPGLILWAMVLVAVPACMIERTSATNSIRRSMELSADSTVPILLTALVGLLAFAVLHLAIYRLSLSLSTLSNGAEPVMIALQSLIRNAPSILQIMTSTAFTAVAYIKLRGSRDHVDVHELARVFS